MTDRMKDKVAIVTGGASGIGRASVLTFLREGARVVVADLSVARGEETLALASEEGFADAVRFFHGDVSSEADVESMVSFAVTTFGGLDCMFNNAGVGGAMGAVIDTTVEDWDKTQAVLLRSVFLGIKHAGRAMRTSGRGGSIINTSSTAGMGGGSGPAAYSAAKAGVVNLTRCAAIELAADLIRVNAIVPGGIRTPLVPVGDDAAMLKFMKGRQPWPKAGQSEHIANAALYLASDESSYTTGTTLVVDGGLLAWGPSLFPHDNASSRIGFSDRNTR